MQYRATRLRLNKFQYGLGMFEFILVLAIVLSITPIVVYQINLYTKRQLGQQYAGQTIAYAKAFSRYLHDYNTDCMVSEVTYDDLRKSGYLPIGMKDNAAKYGEPRVSCTKDAASNAIQAVMYYYDKGYTPEQREKDRVKLLFAKDAAMGIGVEAGVYRNLASLNLDEKQILGIGGAWSIKNTELPAGISQKNIPENSLVINLAMMPDYATMLINPKKSINGANSGNGNNGSNDMVSANADNYLYRVKDNSGIDAGDVTHTNTMQADITVANKDNASDAVVKYHSIRFTADKNGPILTSAQNPDLPKELRQPNNVSQVALSGGLITGSTQVTEQHSLGESCKPEELGKIVKRTITDKNEPIELARIALLTCKYANFKGWSNFMHCKKDKTSGTGYCYLPLNNVSRTYHVKNNQFKAFECGQESEFFAYIDISSDLRSIIRVRSDVKPKVCFFAPEELDGGAVAYLGVKREDPWPIDDTRFDATSITCTIEPTIEASGYHNDCIP